MPKTKIPTRPNHATVAAAKNQIRRAIIGHARNLPRRAGSFTCPACGNGTRRYAISGVKKIHTTCTTTGCPSWME